MEAKRWHICAWHQPNKSQTYLADELPSADFFRQWPFVCMTRAHESLTPADMFTMLNDEGRHAESLRGPLCGC